MAKRLRASILGILTVLMCFALAFGLTAWNKTTASAATVSEDGTTVTLNTSDDFVMNNAGTIITNLSSDAWTAINGNIDTLTGIVIDIPDGLRGFQASFYSNFVQNIAKPIPITLKIPASAYLFTEYFPEMNVVKAYVDADNEDFSGSDDGNYLLDKLDNNAVAWSNGALPDRSDVTEISMNGVLCGESIHIPANITSIPQETLYTEKTKTITVAAENPAYSDGGGQNCLIDTVNKSLMVSPAGYIPDDGSVTDIADGALRNAENVVIPAAIESLTNRVFGPSLQSLTVAENHPKLSDGGNNCIITKADKKLVFATKQTDMSTVFDGVEAIGKNAFTGLGLTEIVIPNTVTSMEQGALFGCPELASISIPFVGGHKTIAGEAHSASAMFVYIFNNNGEYVSSSEGNYKQVSQPNVRGYVPVALKTVSITGSGITLLNNSLEDLGGEHRDNAAIENFYVPDDIAILSSEVFGYAGGMQENSYVKRGEDKNVYLYSSANHDRPVILFFGNTEDTIVKIPEGVTTIGVDSDLDSSTVPRAFRNAKVRELQLPSTLKRIAYNAFLDCNDLVSVYNLSDVALQKGSTDNGRVALYADVYDKPLTASAEVAFGDYTFIASDSPVLFRYNGSDATLTLPNGYDGKPYTIANDAFKGNTSLVDAVIPANSALNIGNSAFENCENLKSIIIYDLQDSIGTAAFKGCTSLTSVTFYNCHITEIADEAFMNCSSLLEIAVPDTVLTIGTGAFENCTSAVAITLGNKVEYIGASAFAGTTSLKAARIPDSVTTLGLPRRTSSDITKPHASYLFDGSGLESVYIGSGLTYINSMFTNCAKLKSVTFAEEGKITDITRAFTGCSSLTTINIPETVTTAEMSFGGCISLTSLNIPYALIDAYNGYYNLFDASFVYYEYSHLTMYLPEVQGETDEEKAASAKNILAFALYFDNGNYWAHYMNTRVSYTNTQWGGPAEKTEENNASDLSAATADYHAHSVFANVTMILPSKATYDAVYAVLSDADYYKTLGQSGRSFNMTVMVKKTDGSGNVTVPLFPELSQDSLLSKFFYVADVTYRLYKTGSDGSTKLIDSETVQKLAQNGGADIRYVLKTDKYGSKYYAIDESFTMPSMIGATNATGDWKVGSASGDAFTLDGAKISGATTLVNVLGVDEPLILNARDEYTADYTGEAWILPEELAGKVTITAVNGNSSVTSIEGAGTYTVTLTANTDYAFAGDERTATVTVIINKAQAELTWTYDGKPLTDGDVFTKTYDGETIASKLEISYVDASGEKKYIDKDHISRTLNGSPILAAAMGAGDWVLYISDLIRDQHYPNYIFAHASQSFRINNVRLSANDVLNGSEIDLTGNATLNSGMLYIYEDNSHNLIPSRTPLTGYTLVEVINVERSIIRYTNHEWTLVATVKSDSADKFAVNNDLTENNTQTAIGRQTTTFVFNAKDNYEFASSINGGVAERGLAFTVSADGKRLTVTKTWYVVQLANELVKATYTGDGEPTDDDLYTVIDWTYGQDVSFALPKLWHGSEADNVNHVTFTLKMQGKADDIVSNAARADLLIYLNKYMPAGDYTLTLTVEAFDTADASYPRFTREYDFTVAKASIGIDETKLPKDETTGYASYEWELTANANKELFFKAFADKINAAGVLQTVVMSAPKDTFWGTDDGKTYFGNYSVKYNFARMNNERYELATNNYLYEFIAGGARGTYTVYFQIEMLNHENLTNVGEDGRYAYFFTVVVFETVDPVDIHLENVTYTGLKNIPTLNETDVYHVEYDEADDYINAGEHALILVLNDSVHYRWKGVAAGETGLSVKYTIEQALNVFIEAPDIVRWIEGKFDEKENGFIGAAKFGEISYVITDTEDNVIYDLSKNIDKRAEMEAGTYILKATVTGNDNYTGLSDAFTIKILEKVGLPWWAVLLIVLGSLAVAALIIFILWKKGVFQILTEKIVVAIRTKASVDATIASVRTAKRMEEGRQSVADAKRRERIEEMRKKAAEQRALPPEERAAQLEARAQAEAEKAEKIRARSEKMKAKAERMRGEAATEQQPADVEQEAAATETPETPTEE